MSAPKCIATVIVCAASVALTTGVQVKAESCALSCQSSFTLVATSAPAVYFMCPAGDMGSFSNQGIMFEVELRSFVGPLPGWPADAIEVRTCDAAAYPAACAGAAASADHDTDVNGMTMVAGATLAGGGCADGLDVWVRCDFENYPPEWVPLGGTCYPPSSEIHCVEIAVRSPDMNGDLVVDLVDLSAFAGAFEPIGYPYDSCADFDMDGETNLMDLSKFAAHYGPPHHACS